MDIASLALGAFSAAQQLVDAGNRIYQRIKNEKKINAMLYELRVFEVEDQKAQLAIHIELAQAVLRSPLVAREHKEQLKRQWERVKAHLAEIDALIDQMIVNSSIWNSRPRHQARCQLNSLADSKAVSKALSSFRDTTMALRELMKENVPLFLSSNDFTPIDPENRIPLRLDAFLGRGRITQPRLGFLSGVQWFLYESKEYPSGGKKDAQENARILSQKLDRAAPGRGIFKFVGFRHSVEGDHNAFQFIFSGPFDGVPLTTLPGYIRDNPLTPSLNFRLDLCYQLAAAVLNTQTLDLVHKNIRPENIAIVRESRSAQLGSPQSVTAYLVGWQYARQVEGGVTNLSNEVALEKRIYQHPDRQLPTADKEYSMGHDVYSLGVCMLEILTWKPILVMSDPPTVSQAFVAAFEALRYQPDSPAPTGPYTKFPNKIKATLIRMNELDTPAAAGERATRLIRRFLTCLDEDDEEDEADGNKAGVSGDAVEPVVLVDEDERRVAMHFVDTALKDLRNLVCTV